MPHGAALRTQASKAVRAAWNSSILPAKDKRTVPGAWNASPGTKATLHSFKHLRQKSSVVLTFAPAFLKTLRRLMRAKKVPCGAFTSTSGIVCSRLSMRSRRSLSSCTLEATQSSTGLPPLSAARPQRCTMLDGREVVKPCSLVAASATPSCATARYPSRTPVIAKAMENPLISKVRFRMPGNVAKLTCSTSYTMRSWTSSARTKMCPNAGILSTSANASRALADSTAPVGFPGLQRTRARHREEHDSKAVRSCCGRN
mmetsp:Transcript_19344/g.42203  ORF Transcript_19344/g.42203 Transcript_19344/m.42203 type:complete len:258 (-) Transcript_19344:2295-3068(-)